MRETCERFGVSQSAYYRHRRRCVSEHERAASRKSMRGALPLVLARAFSPETAGDHAGRIVSAVLEREEYATAAGLLRLLVPEGKVWETVEASARGHGADVGEVWESLYAPSMESL